jgi:hypothetical protein
MQQKAAAWACIAMPICFITQHRQRVIATERAALRRLTRAPKAPSRTRELHDAAVEHPGETQRRRQRRAPPAGGTRR